MYMFIIIIITTLLHTHILCTDTYLLPSKWLWLLRYSGSSFDLSPPRLGLGHPYFSFVCTSVFASFFALALAFTLTFTFTFTPHAMQCNAMQCNLSLLARSFFASEARPSPHVHQSTLSSRSNLSRDRIAQAPVIVLHSFFLSVTWPGVPSLAFLLNYPRYPVSSRLSLLSHFFSHSRLYLPKLQTEKNLTWKDMYGYIPT